jgi:hypothetical protein
MHLLTIMNRYRLFFSFGTLLVISACGELPSTNPITVAGLVFYNNTASPVHNAKLSVTTTRGLVACGVILPGKECSTTFPVRQYQGNPIIVTWEQVGQTWSSGEIYVQLPPASAAAAPTIAVVTLGVDGAIDAKLVPQSSSLPVPGELQPQLR